MMKKLFVNIAWNEDNKTLIARKERMEMTQYWKNPGVYGGQKEDEGTK